MARRAGLLCRLVAIVMIAGAAGCAAVIPPELSHPVSEQTLEFYPGLVKGFEHTYPARTILILAVETPCQTQNGGAAADAPAGDFQVGETLDIKGGMLQRLYMAPIGGVVQQALTQAATEAGLSPQASSSAAYTGTSNTDYVLQGKVLQCSLRKQRIATADTEPSWQTVASFGVDVTLYKPPFHVPFWQTTSIQNYTDPPDAGPPGADEDDAPIYGQPGQVLSVAFTRSIESVFARPDLRTLITQDPLTHH